MDIEKLRANLKDQAPDILKRQNFRERGAVLQDSAEIIVERFRALYDSVHPEKDENDHGSYNENVVAINLSAQELTMLGRGQYQARLRGFGRVDIMSRFNEQIRANIEPEPWTHYASAKGFVVSYHFIKEESEQLVDTELFGAGQFKNGKWEYWKEYLDDDPTHTGALMPLINLGVRLHGAERVYRRMEKRSVETLELLERAAADPGLNADLVARAAQIRQSAAAV